MSIKKFDVTGDPTPDNTAGGTNGETDRPASSDVVYDINTAVALNTAKVTNATHTGDVTGATELTIAAGAVDVAMLADGTDGQLITWDADGKPAVVATGDATQVLTSNGAGAAPTFQAAAGGGDVATDSIWTAAGTYARGTGVGTAAEVTPYIYTTILMASADDPLTTGTNKNVVTIEAPCTLTIVEVRLCVKTAPTDASIIVDINKNGTSIWDSTQANRATIADAATEGTQTSFDTTALSKGDNLTFDIDQVGSTEPGEYLAVEIICKQSLGT